MQTMPRLLVPIAALLALSTGCKSIADRARQRAEEKAIESQTGGQVQVSGDKIVIRVDGGTLAMGGNAQVPDDFPKAVAVYPGAKVDMAAKTNGTEGKPAWSVILETPDDVSKVVAFYKSNLGSFKQASDMSMGDSHMSVYQSAQYDVSFVVAPAQGHTSITLTVGSK